MAGALGRRGLRKFQLANEVRASALHASGVRTAPSLTLPSLLLQRFEVNLPAKNPRLKLVSAFHFHHFVAARRRCSAVTRHRHVIMKCCVKL